MLLTSATMINIWQPLMTCLMMLTMRFLGVYCITDNMFFTRIYLSVRKPFTLCVAGTIINLSLPKLLTWTIDQHFFNQSSLQRLLLSIEFIITLCLHYFNCFISVISVICVLCLVAFDNFY